MRIKSLLFIAFISLFVQSFKAQSHEHEKWFPVLISIHGTVAHQGVKANAMITTCNNEPVMLLELVNTNNYKVKAEWLHAPITKDNKQHYKDELQTIELNAGETKTGKCGEAKQLIIKLSDYRVNVNDLQDYYGSNFNVTK
jgi:hypothetical protein